jgi:hypothetical protein
MNFNDLNITKDDILDKIVEKLLDELDAGSIQAAIKQAITREMVAKVQPLIDSVLAESIGDLIDKPYTPVNEWGEPTRQQPTTLRAMVQDRSLAYLDEKVDKNGKKAGYDSVGTRAEWLAANAAEKIVDRECKAELAKLVATAKAGIQRRVATFITETVLKP